MYRSGRATSRRDNRHSKQPPQLDGLKGDDFSRIYLQTQGVLSLTAPRARLTGVTYVRIASPHCCLSYPVWDPRVKVPGRHNFRDHKHFGIILTGTSGPGPGPQKRWPPFARETPLEHNGMRRPPPHDGLVAAGRTASGFHRILGPDHVSSLDPPGKPPPGLQRPHFSVRRMDVGPRYP